jgi:hypothetical protein
MSALSSALDTHKDREVRLGLEPIGKLADQTGCVVLGNAQHRHRRWARGGGEARHARGVRPIRRRHPWVTATAEAETAPSTTRSANG